MNFLLSHDQQEPENYPNSYPLPRLREPQRATGGANWPAIPRLGQGVSGNEQLCQPQANLPLCAEVFESKPRLRGYGGVLS